MKKEPKFCIITPIAYLDQYAKQSKMHLVLAHLVDQSKEYESFYASSKAFKILDNSAFELGESYAPDRLIELGKKCKADAIVLPDYPFKKAKTTIAAAKKLITKVKQAGFKTAFVPQSTKGNFDDWLEGYNWAVTNPDIDIICMSILGIPNALAHIPKSFARVVMAQMLKDRGYTFEKHHHWLGLQNASLEIPALLSMNVVDSLDSSNPIWAAICGHKYDKTSDSFLLPTKEMLPSVNFDFPYAVNPIMHNTIQENLNVIKEMFDFAT